MAKGDTLNTLTNHRSNNLIINGAMDNFQRGTNLTGVPNGYTADRYYYAPTGVTANIDVAQSSDVPSNINLKYSMKVTNQSTVASVSASAFSTIYQKIPTDFARSLSGKKASCSFWAKTNKAGYYNFWAYLGGGSATISYELAKNMYLPANTWTKVTFRSLTNLPSDHVPNGLVGGYFGVHFCAGSNYYGNDTTDWRRIPDNSIIRGNASSVNWHDTIGNEFYMTGLMLTDNEDENAAFEYPGGSSLIDTDLCFSFFQRRLYLSNKFVFNGIAASTTTLHGKYSYLKPMIQAPTISLSNNSDFRIYNNVLGNTTITSPQFLFVSNIDCLFNMVGPGSLTGGAIYVMQSLVSTAYVDLDAEI
jgi:hypothetical protein